MKPVKFLLVLLAFAGFSFTGCSENSLSPQQPLTTVFDNSNVSLNKKGPVLHSVEGSGLLSYNGKNLGARYTAHHYDDGSFGGEYEINGANATGDPTFKWNGRVLSFKIFENAGEFDGRLAIFLGQEKTGVFAGWYDVFFAIDNDKPGQASAPDQVNFYVVSSPTFDYVFHNGKTIADFYNLSPDELILTLGILNCDKGNITIK